jgi:uncharacterized protein (UPF0332 family)/predicted nucleotidyltransferase
MLNLNAEDQSWLDLYLPALREQFPEQVEEFIIFGSKARGDDGPDSDLDVLIVTRDGGRQLKEEINHLGHSLGTLTEAIPSIIIFSKEEWQERAGDGSPFYRAVIRDGVPMMGMGRVGSNLLPGSSSQGGVYGMSNYVIGHWNRAKASIGGALSLLRDEYYADSVSLAYYAILHAAKAALQFYGVSTESHSGVHRMFALHLIRPGIVEPEWGDDIRQSADRRLLSNYDVTTTFDETDARESCERAQAFLDRIRILLGDALPAEDE